METELRDFEEEGGVKGLREGVEGIARDDLGVETNGDRARDLGVTGFVSPTMRSKTSL